MLLQPTLPPGALAPSVDTVLPLGHSGLPWAVAFTCVLLHPPSKQKKWREGVGELQDTGCSDESGESRDVGDSGADDPCDGPVEYDKNRPEVASALGAECWCTEVGAENVVVDELDADVCVENGGDGSRGKADDVADKLDGVVVKVEGGENGSVLSLHAVDEQTKEHVHDVAECLSAESSLPEVPGATHLGHELGEDHCSSVGKDGELDTLDLEVPASLGVLGYPAGEDLGLREIIVAGLRGDGVVDAGGGHNDDHESKVEPDVDVCEPGKVAERLDLSRDHTKQSPEDTERNVAELVLDDGCELRSTSNDEDSDVEDKLERLENVEKMTDKLAKGALSQVGIAGDGELLRVHGHVQTPKDLSTSKGEEEEEGVDEHTWSET